jgi:hypothetical protein
MSVLACRCPYTPLNGASANTEGGRLRLALKNCALPLAERLGNPEFCCTPPTPSIQPTITPCESSRIASLIANCPGSTASGQVTQSRAQQLLQQFQQSQTFQTETARIVQKVEDTLLSSVDPLSETARFSTYNRLPAAEVCPPLPPPPAPPARACPLEKNRKF